MKNNIVLFSIMIAFAAPVWAFPSPSAKATILELLNGKSQKGQLDSKLPVSFDDVVCNRLSKSCSVQMRFMIPQDDFFLMKKGSCTIEPIDTVYDILDEKSGDLTSYFLKEINACL